MSHRHAGCRSHAHAGGGDVHPFSLPGSTEHYAASRPVRVSHVALDVSLHFEDAAVKGSCTTRLTAVRDVEVVTFDAVDLDVSEVTVDGKAARLQKRAKSGGGEAFSKRGNHAASDENIAGHGHSD